MRFRSLSTLLMHQRSYTKLAHRNLYLAGMIAFVLGGSSVFCEIAVAEDTVYMFSYFKEPNGTDGLHLAYSLDGLSYHAVNSDVAITAPNSTLMRDPNVIYGQDGKFHLLYTTSWTGTSFGYSESTNLVNWSAKTSIDVMGSVSGTEETWAPESFWDATNNRYMVYWSSATTSGGPKKIYYSTTTDYANFSTPAVLYDPGFTTIDATIVKDGSNYVLFCKDERDGQKYVFKTPASTSPTGPFLSSPLQRASPSGVSAEGATVIKIGSTWYCYTDPYNNGAYMAMSSTDDMATWTNITSTVTFPSAARHGNVFEVPRSVADYLIANAPLASSEIEFDGQTSGTTDYATGSNWLGGSIPGANQTALIQNGQTANLASSISITVAKLLVGQTSSGVLNISGNTTLNVSGDVKIGRLDSIGSLNISGGVLNTTGNIQIDNGAVHLDGGTISTPSVNGNGSAAIHFNGGTLKATNSSTTFMQGLNTIDVESGGAIIDTNGNNITIPQALSSASATGGLTKSGPGILTLIAANTYSGATTITQGTLKLDSTPVPTATHRWSFNNSLADSVGGSNATIVEVGSRNVSLTSYPGQATLTGGSSTSSDYISLGSNLLPKTNSPITIELWATQRTARNWSRIFDFGSSDLENLFMSWSGSTSTSDRVEWKDGATNTSDNTNQPYNTNTEYHIVMELNPVGNSTVVTWYSAASANANLGSAKGSFTSSNTLANFIDSADNLGRSSYSGDNTASASYNEVRFWDGALSSNILEILHNAGPNANINTLNYGGQGSLPSTTDVNITASGAILDLNGFNQTIASLTGVAGSQVKLGNAALTVGNNASTTFAGSINSTTGGSLIKQGSGTLTLTGTCAYNGETIINAGQLQLLTGTTSLNTISGQGELIVGSGTQLTATSINLGTVTLAANSRITIRPISGGPQADSTATTPVPEPGTWILLITITSLSIGYCVKHNRRNK
jgi:autotransporter-associated beta strand protein